MISNRESQYLQFEQCGLLEYVSSLCMHVLRNLNVALISNGISVPTFGPHWDNVVCWNLFRACM